MSGTVRRTANKLNFIIFSPSPSAAQRSSIAYFLSIRITAGWRAALNRVLTLGLLSRLDIRLLCRFWSQNDAHRNFFDHLCLVDAPIDGLTAASDLAQH